jgi:hypothetical protein
MWYPFMGTVECASCHISKDIVSIQCNSECHVKIWLQCHICGEKTTREYSIITLKEFADSLDFQAQQKKANELQAQDIFEKVADDLFLLSMRITPTTPQGKLR